MRTSIAQRINALNSSQQQKQSEEKKKTSNFINEMHVTTSEINIEHDSSEQSADNFIETEVQYSTIKRSPHNKVNSSTSFEESNVTSEVNNVSENQKESSIVVKNG